MQSMMCCDSSAQSVMLVDILFMMVVDSSVGFVMLVDIHG